MRIIITMFTGKRKYVMIISYSLLHVKQHPMYVINHETSTLLIGAPSMNNPCLCNWNGKFSGDHLVMYFSIDMHKPYHIRKDVAFRKYRSICVLDFIMDMASSAPLNNVDQPLSDVVESHNTGIESLI